MKRGPIARFIIRWFVCSLGLWVTAGLLDGRLSFNDSGAVVIVSGLILAIINAIIKPLVVILSLPAILFSLGLFMIVINGFMVMLVAKLYPQLYVDNFGVAMVAGIVIGLVNYLVTTFLED